MIYMYLLHTQMVANTAFQTKHLDMLILHEVIYAVVFRSDQSELRLNMCQYARFFNEKMTSMTA